MADDDREQELAQDLSPQDVAFHIENHGFDPRKLRRDRHHHKIPPRERMSYAHHFRWLHAEGKTFRTIAEEFDCSHTLVQRLVNESINEDQPLRREKADRASIDRIEILLARWMPVAVPENEQGIAALERVIKLYDQLNKVTGAYAPERADLTVREVDARDVELAEMIQEAKARGTERAGAETPDPS